MTVWVDAQVKVPADRVGEFYAHHGKWLAQQFPTPLAPLTGGGRRHCGGKFVRTRRASAEFCCTQCNREATNRRRRQARNR